MTFEVMGISWPAVPAKVIVMIFPPPAVQAELPVLKVTVPEPTVDNPINSAVTCAALASNAIGAVVWPPNVSIKVPPVPVHTAVCTVGCPTNAALLEVMSARLPALPVKDTDMIFVPSTVHAVVGEL